MMAGMEIDSPSPTERSPLMSPRDRIVQRLALRGVPHEVLEQSQMELVYFLKENNVEILEIVSSILPTNKDVSDFIMTNKAEHSEDSSSGSTEDLFGESMMWLQWLMFESEPSASLKALEQKASGQRAVCGAVWGQNDLAYRCRTCEHDPTCAICVPCFLNGNHKDHDYSIMYTGGGCCDCGDVTAWKLEGFCSLHRGIEQIEPLPEGLANSIGAVLDAILMLWKDASISAEHSSARQVQHIQTAEKLTSSVVNMLLEFCRCSESLLSFISRRMFECVDLLDVLVRSERFFDKTVVKKLHELLLKLLGEPLFKYEFAKVFTRYYPVIVNEIIKSDDSILDTYPLLSTFSVQIFTVPTLTPRLVCEVNLLGVLFGCLMDLFRSCVGEDNHIQASKWTKHYDSTIRVVEDIRYILSHDEVPSYVAYERPDISVTWLELLTLVQGMDAQKRVTGSPVDEENENLSAPFVLGHLLGNVNNLLVQGALSVFEAKEPKVASFCRSDSQNLDGSEDQRHSKVGKTLQGSSVCSISRSRELDCVSHYNDVNSDAMIYLCVPTPAIWLITECLKAIDGWLFSETSVGSNFFSIDATKNTHSMLTFRKKILKIMKGTSDDKLHKTSSKIQGMEEKRPPYMHYERLDPVGSDIYHEYTSLIDMSVDSHVEVDSGLDSGVFAVLGTVDWPDICYDVSSQEISFHIPLHRLLSLLLRKTMKMCCGEIEKMAKTNKSSVSLPLSSHGHEFFGKLLGWLHPYGFSAFLMEHPLHLRVFCAQVHAGMWRRNGDGALLNSEMYRSVQWFKQGLEYDLFLLQCCAALAPPELFVKRIQERFGLSNFTSLKLSEHNKYEAVLVREMLTLIIQIVVERRFSGLSTSDSLKRELIYRLAIGDATHSQLVKSLPRDLSKSEELQNVVDMVAVYSDPSRLKQGRYSLRKTYWRELDLYHPRWSFRDLQAAEERYFRFCKTSAVNTQLPRWSDVYGPLRSISHVATSLAVSQIVRAVLYNAAFSELSSVSRIPDGVLITALHMLSLALDICGSQSYNNDTHRDPCISSSHLDNSCTMDLQNHGKDLAPILTCSTEEFSSPAHDESDLCRKQTMLSLLVILMRKHKEDNDNYSGCAETRHCNISVLIENLLKKFAELNSECLTTLQHLAPEVVLGMLRQSPSLNAQSSASTSDSRERKAKAREHQAAMMAKMRAQQSKFIACLKSTPESKEDVPILKENESKEDHNPEDSVPVCALCRDPESQSALCFLVLLQKSRLATFVDRGPLSWENGGLPSVEMHSRLIKVPSDQSDVGPNNPMQSVGTAGIEISSDVEPAEVNTLLDYFKQHLLDIRNIKLFNASADAKADTSLPLERIEDEVYRSVKDLHDAHKSIALDGKQKHLASNVEAEPKTFSSVLGEYIACLSREPKQNRSSSTRRTGNLTSQSAMPNIRFGAFGPSDCDGIHISSCGHAVHQECHERYLFSLQQRYIRRLGFEGVHIVDPDMGELLCPVCRRFANSILPAYPGILNKICKRTPLMSSQTSSGLPSSSCSPDAKTLQLSSALFLIQNTGKIVGQGKILKAFSGKLSESTNPALEPCLQKLYMLYYPRSYNTLESPGRLSKSLLLWDILRYSVISTEIAARWRMHMYAVNSKSCLSPLYGELESSSGYILSVLLHIAQSARSFNRLEVLSRFRGLQLLAGSICSGVSCHNFSIPDKRMLSSLTEKTEDGESFPDIQFWELAGGPVLAQDPFSSLLWVLFCLPRRFISSSEVFIALVHLFYVVCVVQSMITCYGNQSFDASNFGVFLLGDVCKSMSESELVRRFFVSSYVDSLCHPKDMIRRLTFPYLRRCAMLWKLLNYSTVAPLYGGSHTLEGSYLFVDNKGTENSNHLMVELNGIQELENLFGICSLDMILNDETVHALSVRWCRHLFEESRVLNDRIYTSAPAVPFKLMKLPQLYQDLLQRYVKSKCSYCKLVPEQPALCLLCGQLCSANWKSCCRRSKCLVHATTCGAGIGIFLLVRKTTILLQRFTRQTFWPSPYLDAFGEEDHDMHRGKPLNLSEERYATLTYMVASHGLDRSSEVLRQTTISFTGFD